MSSSAIDTIIKMIESLPGPVQDQVMERLREYIQDVQDELKWNTAFKDTQPQLIASARHAKQEIAAGHARPCECFFS